MPPADRTPFELTPLEVLRLYRPHDGSLGDLVASRAERARGEIALRDDTGSWTWAQMIEDTARLAVGLTARGVVQGDRVLIAARNSAWHVLLLQALAHLGAAIVPVNPDYREKEMRHVIAHSAPRLVLFDDAAATVASAVAGALGVAAEPLGAQLMGEGVTPANGHADATLVVIYTSGTTGAPKGVMHSQSSFIAAGEAFIERLHLQPDERMLVILPLFHINALFYSVGGFLAAGARLYIAPRFSASGFWPLVHREDITQVNVIEAVSAILTKRPSEEYLPGHLLQKVYGVRDNMVAPLHEKFGIPHLIGGYAMTEIPGVLSTPFDAPNRPGSMGRLCRHPDPARPWAECRIVDEEGNVLGPDQPGELQVKTPIVMQGYLNDPEQTQAAFSGAWFRTGDLVRCDADGFFYFIARMRDIIRRRGENISGAELDQVISQHPDVLHGAVIGVPSPFGDEDILAAVVTRPGHNPSAQSISDWCTDRLAAIKRPRYVAFVEALPMTPTHKVAKAKLREIAADLQARATAID